VEEFVRAYSMLCQLYAANSASFSSVCSDQCLTSLLWMYHCGKNKIKRDMLTTLYRLLMLTSRTGQHRRERYTVAENRMPLRNAQ
jgi:hypothetical protein